MPTAHFQDLNPSPPVEVKGRSFATPKRLDRPESWVTAARKAIPEIPNLRETDWQILSFDPSLGIILIEFINPRNERCKLAIAR